jgi:ribonuclease J
MTISETNQNSPAPQHPDTVRILPLGGLGEIGLNMMTFETNGQMLIVDCGLMFPEAYMLGIDLVIPDISTLSDRQTPVTALVLTHGHEDHIGAIPFLLEALGNPPIYGTPLTLGLLRGKLEEHKLIGKADLRPVQPRQSIDLGPFQVEFFRAAHSIVDGCGLAIRTPAGLIVHTGDFKLDPTPVDNQPTDLGRLAAYGEEGVLLLMADSTNVEQPGQTLSERTVGEAFDAILPGCHGRIFIATFSSNIHRIQQVVDAAAKVDRKIFVSGRSMVSNIAIARQLGYLKVPDDMLINLHQMRDLASDRVVVLTTGSQGEPLSALSRIALADHKQLKLEPGDTVILSSKFIPGNEKAISDLINHLYRQGAEVHYETTSEVHVSGHACREELKTVHNLVRPRYFVPGRVFVDGKGVGDVGEMELRDRSHLANHGMVIVFLAMNQSSGEIVSGPDIITRGFVPEEEGATLIEDARQLVCDMLQERSHAVISDWEELRVEVRKTLRRFFNKSMERRPLILPVIMEL